VGHEKFMNEMAELAGVPIVEDVEPLEERKADKQVSDTFYKYFDRVQIDLFAIPNVYKEIEKMLAVRPDKKDVDRAMKDMVKRYKRESVEGGGKPISERYSPDEERLLDEVILTASNEGRFYPDDAKGAVKKVIRDIQKTKTQDLKEMLKAIEDDAITSVADSWHEGMREGKEPDGEPLEEADSPAMKKIYKSIKKMIADGDRIVKDAKKLGDAGSGVAGGMADVENALYNVLSWAHDE